jgi:hypothetical protein
VAFASSICQIAFDSVVSICPVTGDRERNGLRMTQSEWTLICKQNDDYIESDKEETENETEKFVSNDDSF